MISKLNERKLIRYLLKEGEFIGNMLIAPTENPPSDKYFQVFHSKARDNLPKGSSYDIFGPETMEKGVFFGWCSPRKPNHYKSPVIGTYITPEKEKVQ